MKIKSKIIIAIVATVNFIESPITTLAQSEQEDCDRQNLTNAEKLNCLLSSEEELIEGSPQGQETKTSLPHGDIFKDFLPFFVNTAISIAGTLIFTALLYAGYLLVTANDVEEKIEKGKKIMIYSIVGAVVMAVSYAVIYGVANLDLD